MVFAVQCPNAKCRKWMLVEDHDRGKVVKLAEQYGVTSSIGRLQKALDALPGN